MNNIDNSRIANQKPRLNVKGTLLGTVAGTLAKYTFEPAISLTINKMVKNERNLSKDEIQIVNKAGDNILSNITNLASKGVTVKNLKKIENLELKEYSQALIIEGKDALFDPATNSVIINRDKSSLSLFHELGHAFNYNNSAFWKTVQKQKFLGTVLSSFIALIPVITKESKAKEGEELTNGQKFKNSLRKASPILAAAALLPQLGEEAIASIRANKWSKQLLDKNLSSKVIKSDRLGYSTYIMTALEVAVGTFVGRKVKDYFQEKQENNK